MSKFKLNQAVFASNQLTCDEGAITSIKGTLYKVGKYWYTEDEITSYDGIKQTPMMYYTAIQNAEEGMEEEIYNLILKYGFKKGDKYIFPLSKGRGKNITYANVRNSNGRLVQLKRAEILSHKTSMIKGYLQFIDTDNNVCFFEGSLPHQQFNVYSTMFRYIFQ